MTNKPTVIEIEPASRRAGSQVVGQFDSSPINLARITRDLIMAARASSSAANNFPILFWNVKLHFLFVGYDPYPKAVIRFTIFVTDQSIVRFYHP